MKPILISDSFYDRAKGLRDYFDAQFAHPKSPSGTNIAKRFVWDYWHVPDQYTVVRTPAYHYFPEKEYVRFHSALVQWGRENLGCHDISPTWLSYYVEGCKQELHTDFPHGPWAFVYSLTPWTRRVFSGGETLILKPELLNYWPNYMTNDNREKASFVERVPAKFNRLTVFDPRLPHAVTEVRGTHDPREARVVIHGWFVEPRPYVVGALTTSQVMGPLSEAMQILQEQISQQGDFHGTVSFRLKVSPSGEVQSFAWLTNTLVNLNHDEIALRSVLRFIRGHFLRMQFAAKRQSSQITIPILFK